MQLFRATRQNEVFRLPGTVFPTLYEMDWVLAASYVLRGHVKIHACVKSNDPLSVVELHALFLNFKDCSITIKRENQPVQVRQLPSSALRIDLLKETVSIFVGSSSPLLPGDEIIIDISYTASITPWEPDGHRWVDGIFNFSEDPNCVCTHFEPTHARKVYPCFDEPEYKAAFKMRLTSSAGYKALSNTPIMSQSTNDEEGTITTEFETTPVMSPCLLVVVTGKFQCCETETKRGVVCRIWVDEIFPVDDGLFALGLLERAVDFYEELFRYHIPLRQLDIIGLPDFPVLAMENFGLLCFARDHLLVSKDTSMERQRRIARLVGHEVCHQWFGNIVSLKWWTHIWLKEGFCRYMEFVFVHSHFPKWQIWCDYVVQVQNVALTADSTNIANRRAIEVKGDLHPRRIFDFFDVISYGKAASVIRMFAGMIGETSFQDAVALFIKRHEFSVASADDIFRCFDECTAVGYEFPAASSPPPVSVQIRDWVNVLGHPYILVERRPTEGALILRQYLMPDTQTGFLGILAEKPVSSFVATPTELVSSQPNYPSVMVSLEDITSPSKFFVTAKATVIERGQTAVSRQFGFWDETFRYETKSSMVWFHTNCIGAFRVDYDFASWMLLLEVYPFLSALDRLAICTSVFELRTLRIGRIFPDEPFDRCILPLVLLQAITEKEEKHNAIWSYVANQLLVMQCLVLSTPAWQAFKLFLQRCLRHFVAEKDVLSFFASSVEDFQPIGHLSDNTRNDILRIACIADEPSVIKDAINFAQWILSAWFLDVPCPEGLTPCTSLAELDMERVHIAFRVYASEASGEGWWRLFDLLNHFSPHIGVGLNDLILEKEIRRPQNVCFKVNGDVLPDIMKDIDHWVGAVITGLVLRQDSELMSVQLGILDSLTQFGHNIAFALIGNSPVLSSLIVSLANNRLNPKMYEVVRIVSKYCANGIVCQQLAAIDPIFARASQLNTTWADYVANHFTHYLKEDEPHHSHVSSTDSNAVGT